MRYEVNMERIVSFEEVLLYLKDKAVISTNGKNMFYLKDGNIIHAKGDLKYNEDGLSLETS